MPSPSSTNTDHGRPESTIAPFYTGLNGVDIVTNMLCRDILWGSLGLVVVIILALRVLEMIWNKTRQRAVLSAPPAEKNQESWKSPRTSWTAKLKRHLIYASISRKRHHREYRIFSLNFGTLPSRLHIIFILFYWGSNIAYLAALKRDNPNRYAVYAELRGRSGTLCVANMVPLIILAGRNNPLIPALKISFDTYNLFHRWIGRIAVVEIVIHIVCWLIPVVDDGGWGLVGRKIRGDLFLASGLVGVICLVLVLLLSLSPLRHAYYETFLSIHILLACVIFACCWIHCVSSTVKGGLPQLPWIMAVVYLWAGDRLIRTARTLYINWSGKTVTSAVCEALPGDVTRVTLSLPRFVGIKPGTHAYLRFWGVRAWESHPFSIAWVDHVDISHIIPVSTVAPQYSRTSKRACITTKASFIIAAQTGVTRRLYNKTKAAPGGTLCLKATMEGPYAGYHNFDSYGHMVLIAGAGGITHQVSYLRRLLENFNAGTAALRRLLLIWVVRDHTSLGWIQPHLEELRRIPHSQEMLRVKVFVTRYQQDRVIGDTTEDTNPITEVFAGRPLIPSLLGEEIKDQIGAMCVSVCGPGALTDDVRGAVRAVQGASVVDFVEESFTW